jgi:diguanylate cyclase (GGDEF)-like protein/PAS domain S-box-containing protein
MQGSAPAVTDHATDVFRTFVDVLEQGVLLVDGEGTILAGNPSAERILGFETSRVCGAAVPWSFVDETGEPVPPADLPCQRSIRTGEEQRGVVLGVTRMDGSFAWVEFNARPTLSGSSKVAVLSFTDVTEAREERTRLQELAQRDTLTGLFNRRHFDDALRRQIALCRRGQIAALVLIDLDHLKEVNDTLGHLAGDGLLRDAAKRIDDLLRAGDVLSRYGGDEFALLLHGADMEEGEAIAHRIAGALAEQSIAGGPAPSASIGVCALDASVSSADAALAAADAALYAAKRTGGGCVHSASSPGALAKWRPARTTLRVFESLGDEDQHLSVDRIVAAARELLGMDVAYSTHHTPTEQVFESLAGDGESFGVSAETRMPLEATYCQRILDGELPSLMPNLSSIPAAAAMPVTQAAGVEAYVSVPITLASGELYGTLCCAAHEARADLAESDIRYLRLLAHLIGDLVERGRVVAERAELRAASSGLQALVAAVEARDHYTSAHSEVVLELVAGVARRLGLAEQEVAVAEQVGLLHDLGKLSIPDAILHKPGPLDPSEWEIMRGHPDAGARLVAAVPGLEHLADAIRAEHERWDGAGYPLGLAGEDIPVASRIVFVCDAYHAMTSDRPYRAAMPREEALAEIAAAAGTQFCPTAAKALAAELAKTPVLSP